MLQKRIIIKNVDIYGFPSMSSSSSSLFGWSALQINYS